jgi:hypothetical protein
MKAPALPIPEGSGGAAICLVRTAKPSRQSAIALSGTFKVLRESRDQAKPGPFSACTVRLKTV